MEKRERASIEKDGSTTTARAARHTRTPRGRGFAIQSHSTHHAALNDTHLARRRERFVPGRRVGRPRREGRDAQVGACERRCQAGGQGGVGRGAEGIRGHGWSWCVCVWCVVRGVCRECAPRDDRTRGPGMKEKSSASQTSVRWPPRTRTKTQQTHAVYHGGRRGLWRRCWVRSSPFPSPHPHTLPHAALDGGGASVAARFARSHPPPLLSLSHARASPHLRIRLPPPTATTPSTMTPRTR